MFLRKFEVIELIFSGPEIIIAEDETETKHLEAMEGADTRLCLCEMDLLDADSIAAAVKGCNGVIHLACPNVIGQVKDPEVLYLESTNIIDFWFIFGDFCFEITILVCD